MIRRTITVTPEAKDVVQAALDLAALGGEISAESWTPYPAPDDVKLYWVGWQGDEAVFASILLAVGAIVGLRHRAGPVRLSGPVFNAALSASQLIAQFPLPDSGPLPDVVVTPKAALAAHYRDFLLGPLPEDGMPG